MISKPTLLSAVKKLLAQEIIANQSQLCEQLNAMFDCEISMSQSKVSRLLRECGAVKINKNGRQVYSLPQEGPPATGRHELAHLIVSVVKNEVLVVVRTSPGAAQLVARLLDFQPSDSQILATIAGDDAIFVAPKSVTQIKALYTEIRDLLGLV